MGYDPRNPLPPAARVSDLARLAAIPLFRTLGLVARGGLLESGRVLEGPHEETLEGPAALVAVLDGTAEIRARYSNNTADVGSTPAFRLAAGDHSPLHACFDESARADA